MEKLFVPWMAQATPTQTQTQKTTSKVMQRFKDNLSEHIPQASVLAILLVVVFILKNFSNPKSKLAKGGLGSNGILRKSRKKGLEEMGTKLNKTTLWIGDPEREDCIFLRSALPAILVSGGPNSGKTFGPINETMLSCVAQKLPMLIVDFKYPKQTSRIADYAKRCGYKVRILAPTYPESGCLNPVGMLRDHTDMLRAEEIISVSKKNLTQTGKTSDGDKYWDDLSTQVLAGGLCLVKTLKYPDLLTLKILLEDEDLPQRLIDNRDKIPASVYSKLKRLTSAKSSSRQYNAIRSTCLQLLDKMTNSEFLPAIAGETSIDPILSEGEMLIIGLNREFKEVLAPTLSMFIHMTVEMNMNKQRKHPLMTFIDELPAFDLPKLDSWLAEGREDGFGGVLAFQSIKQLIERYGANRTETIFTSSPTKIFMNPNNIKTAKEIADWTGDIEVKYRTKSDSRNKQGTSKGTSEHNRIKLALEPTEICRMKEGRAVVISPGFEQGQDKFIPCKLDINPPIKHQKIIKISERQWKKKLRPELIAANQERKFTDKDIEKRRLYLEDLYPLKKSEEDDEAEDIIDE